MFAKAAVLDEHSGVMLTRLDTRASLFIYPPRCASVEQNVHVLHFIYPDFPKTLNRTSSGVRLVSGPLEIETIIQIQ